MRITIAALITAMVILHGNGKKVNINLEIILQTYFRNYYTKLFEPELFNYTPK